MVYNRKFHQQSYMNSLNLISMGSKIPSPARVDSTLSARQLTLVASNCECREGDLNPYGQKCPLDPESSSSTISDIPAHRSPILKTHKSVPHLPYFRQANFTCRVGTAHHFLYGAMNRHDSEGSSEWIMSAIEISTAKTIVDPAPYGRCGF